MRDRADVRSIRDRIVFGRAFAAQASAALPRVDVAATAETAAAAGRLWQAA
jgi:hypothetical protein